MNRAEHIHKLHFVKRIKKQPKAKIYNGNKYKKTWQKMTFYLNRFFQILFIGTLI